MIEIQVNACQIHVCVCGESVHNIDWIILFTNMVQQIGPILLAFDMNVVQNFTYLIYNAVIFQ